MSVTTIMPEERLDFNTWINYIYSQSANIYKNGYTNEQRAVQVQPTQKEHGKQHQISKQKERTKRFFT